MTSGQKKLNEKWIALILGLATLVILVLTAPQIGLTWDEPAYIAASESYSEWVGKVFTSPGQAFKQPMIDKYWEVNHEHPPLDKIWSGLVWRAVKPVFDDLTAHRMGNMILVAVMVSILYLMLAENVSRTAGFVAVGLLISMPRFFFHAHLASLDVPAAAAILIVVFVFWKTLDQPGWKGTALLGVIWGLAVATKINAVFVMPTLLIWLLIFRREKGLLLRLAWAGLIAFGVFVLVWPWLYVAPAERIYAYLRWITVDHWQIGQFYLHEFHMPPPWHFPFVMAAAVIPITVLIAYIFGIVRSFRQEERQAFGVLLLLNSVVPLLALSIGQSMVYDNERLFMPAFVFVAALAGMGVDWIIQTVKAKLAEKGRPALGAVLVVVIVLVVFVPQLASAAPLYPHLLSYYSGTVGGLPGAARIGLETTYWCETYTEALPYLNEHAAIGDVVWTDPWSHDVMVYYQMQGRLRKDLQIAVPPYAASLIDPSARLVEADYTAADFVILQYRQTSTVYGGAAFPIMIYADQRTPVVSVSHQGIPLIEVYQNP